MKQLHSRTFDSGHELTQFINNRLTAGIVRHEDIQQITATEIMAGYSAMTTYTLFWWE